MLAHMNDLPQAPSNINPDVPAKISEIVLTAMAKDPSARFQTAEEFRQSLDPSRDQRPTAVVAAAETSRSHVVPSKAVPKRPVTLWSSRRLLLAGCVTFLVAILTFIAVLQHF
jgi:serine/threonine protein kinase